VYSAIRQNDSNKGGFLSCDFSLGGGGAEPSFGGFKPMILAGCVVPFTSVPKVPTNAEPTIQKCRTTTELKFLVFFNMKILLFFN
jgi:hypothetical protein